MLYFVRLDFIIIIFTQKRGYTSPVGLRISRGVRRFQGVMRLQWGYASPQGLNYASSEGYASPEGLRVSRGVTQLQWGYASPEGLRNSSGVTHLQRG